MMWDESALSLCTLFLHPGFCTLTTVVISDDNSLYSFLTQLVSVAALLRRYLSSPYPLLRLLSYVPALPFSN